MADLTQFNSGQPFDTTTAPESSRQFQPIPPGEYMMEIVSAGMHDTRAGNGCYMKVEMCGLDGAASGRKVFWNINLQNPNPKAVEIGLENLDQLREAVGLVSLSDSSQLIGGKVTAKLAVNGEYNDVKYVKASTGAAPAQQAPPAAPPFPAPAAPTQAWGGAAPVAPTPAPTPGAYADQAF